MMQHYGVPTRLLDWSREALVALLFALGVPTSDIEKTSDKVVWVLDPVTLNKAFRFYNNKNRPSRFAARQFQVLV
ncbi:FRG domain-containing protein [Paenibacillus hexagrammi]|uniref:FRG domain-containing protein n=1 Tax=Paenibacillus hexagrammi TaxID=2908839 RepID=UPI003312FE94